MYAVVDIKGFQYKLAKGDKLKVSKYDLEVGKKITFPEVLLVSGEKEVTVGAPFVEGAVVEATVTDQGRHEKIFVFKKKRRKGYTVKNGHRQDFTEIEIKDIKISKKAAAKPVKAEKAADDVKPAKAEKAAEVKAAAKPAAKKKAVPKPKAKKAAAKPAAPKDSAAE